MATRPLLFAGLCITGHFGPIIGHFGPVTGHFGPCSAIEEMTDEEKGASSWYRVPMWSGDPSEWRGFKREMEWWIASLDAEHSRKYNIAARWALRQTGVVRARCEEYDPSELVGTAEVIGKDPESGEDVVLQAADPFSGLRKLMRSLEESMGKTELDRKGELRKQFYQNIRRSPGERISAFCTRYRTLTGEMRREGIHLPSAELGWFLKDRLGLDALRLQLLETALVGREDYDHVEGEVLRLFRDLHVSDPLNRSKSQSFDSHKSYPLQRFLQQSNQQAGSRSAPSSNSGTSVKSFRTSSSYRFSKPGSSVGSARQAYVVEEPEDDAGQEEELLPDDAADGALPSLDEVLQAEAEVLATEIQELEECGDVDPSILENLEDGVEKAAESLVTMREARARINDIKKDRGFGRPAAGSKMKVPSGQVQKKKTSTQCWDCGEYGHWGGDAQCQKPGAGLFKPKSAAKKPPSPQKHVKVMESLNTEHVVDDGDDSHEVMMVHHDSVPFVEALVSSKKEQPSIPGLAKDKVLVGALDSACNRTCAGDVWLQHYIQTLQQCPQHIQSLLMTTEENEMFRFGNGGTQTSRIRYRLPMMIGDNLVLVWVSVVKVPSLGLLLGRDFLDGIGAVISFTKQKLRPDFLNGRLIDLSQVAAGHFALKLMPHTWPRLDLGRWRRWGQDGILEQQMSAQDWFSKKLLVSGKVKLKVDGNEHLLTEQGIRAARFSHDHVPPCLPSLVQEMTRSRGFTSSSTSSSSSGARDLLASTSRSSLRLTATPSSTRIHHGLQEGEEKRHCRGRKVGQNVDAGCRKSPLARFGLAIMACAAAYAPFLTIPISFDYNDGAVADADPRHDERSHLAHQAWQLRSGPKLVYGPESPRAQPISKSSGLATSLFGGPHSGRHDRGSLSEGPSNKDPSGRDSRGKSDSRPPRTRARAAGGGSTVSRTERRLAGFEGRSPEACNLAQVGRPRQDESGRAQGIDSPNDRHLEGSRSARKPSTCTFVSGAPKSQVSSKIGYSDNSNFAQSTCRSGFNERHVGPRRAPAVGRARASFSSHDLTNLATHDVHAAESHVSDDSSRGSPNLPRDLPDDGGRDGRNQWLTSERAQARADGSHVRGRTGLHVCRGGARGTGRFVSTDLGLGLLGQKAANLDFEPSGLLGRRGDGFRSPGVDGLRNPEADLLSQVKLDADDVKKGQAQLIAQAWQKHQRDQRLVSHGHVHAVLKAEWEKEMERNLNENFVTSIT